MGKSLEVDLNIWSEFFLSFDQGKWKQHQVFDK